MPCRFVPWRLVWVMLSIGCGSPMLEDAGAPDTAALDVPSDAGALETGALDAGEVDAPGGCDPRRRVSCEGGGFATFDVSAASALTARGALVHDLRTGLVWQRSTDGTRRTFEEALALCEALSLDGQSDFRLPTRIELLSLVLLGRSPTLDGAIFEGALPDYHWTQSVPAAFAGSSAFSVYFGAGDVAYALAARPTGLARCVAGEPSALPMRFVAEGTEIRDVGTGLSWAREVILAVPQADVESRCTATGHRAPTLLELASIVDESRTNPAIAEVFGTTPASPHWTITEDSLGPRAVDFLHGEAFARDAAEPLALRCVR